MLCALTCALLCQEVPHVCKGVEVSPTQRAARRTEWEKAWGIQACVLHSSPALLLPVSSWEDRTSERPLGHLFISEVLGHTCWASLAEAHFPSYLPLLLYDNATQMQMTKYRRRKRFLSHFKTGYGSLVEQWPSMCKIVDSVTSTMKIKNENEESTSTEVRQLAQSTYLRRILRHFPWEVRPYTWQCTSIKALRERRNFYSSFKFFTSQWLGFQGAHMNGQKTFFRPMIFPAGGTSSTLFSRMLVRPTIQTMSME